MNVVRLMGGLGNQISQYAFGKAIGASYDVSWFATYKNHAHPRPFGLDKFNTKIERHPFLQQETIQENGFDLSLLKKQNCNFFGYWQRLPYYKDKLPVLKQEFHLKEEFYTEDYKEVRNRISGCNSISVHVRRGDYLRQQGFHELSFRYYLESLSALLKDDYLFIFSDDMFWCKEHFKQDFFKEEISFIHMADYLDFDLMRLCKKKVIANSTFSYWAALLSDSVVATPREWLGDLPIEEDLHYPENWIKIRGNVV